MFELAMPWALTVLPLPLLLWYSLPRASLQLPTALKVPFFQDMVSISEQEKHSLTRQTKFTYLLLIWSLLVLALADPRWVGEPRPLVRDGHNIMMVLDLSPSMTVNDMITHGTQATRLNVVKRAATQFVQNRVSDKIGLIVFGERAYLQTPLTWDHHNVLQRINDATAGLAGKSTSIGDALGLAVKRLQNVPDTARIIILLTDGANNSGILAPLKAAEFACDDKIKVYTIGLGAEADTSTFNGLFLKMNASADLDEKTLKTIAKMTHGQYFRATNMASLQAIYQSINQMETISQDEATVRPQHNYYPWPLGLSLLLFMYLLAEQGGMLAVLKRAPHKRVVE